MKESTLKSAKLIFWDFDGVIKESTEIKSSCFCNLFHNYGADFVNKVLCHHLENQGVPRRKKIALYLSWAEKLTTQELIDKYCARFGDLVYEEVISSPWVPGVYNYIKQNYKFQNFIVVSATPINELKRLVKDLNIEHYFSRIYGYPPTKSYAIKSALTELDISPLDSIFIGDAEADLEAARDNNVKFILRRTSSNLFFQERFGGLTFSDIEV